MCSNNVFFILCMCYFCKLLTKEKNRNMVMVVVFNYLSLQSCLDCYSKPIISKKKGEANIRTLKTNYFFLFRCGGRTTESLRKLYPDTSLEYQMLLGVPTADCSFLPVTTRLSRSGNSPPESV